MINHIINLHKELPKGKYVKIITSNPNYTTKVDRTDVLKADGDVLRVFRANSAQVAINCNFVVMCCIVERL